MALEVKLDEWEHTHVSLDTGFYFTGELTAAAFTNNACRMI
ncbi:hypothetical protein [Planktotalea sp.]|nr:hypothetical protein [Planktotalea sp.]